MHNHARLLIATALPSLLGMTIPLGTASAQVDAAPDRAAADDLFRRGLALMKQGKYPDACPKFEASHRLDPSFAALINLGDCYQKVGRTASAWGAYREASDLARKYTDENRIKLAESRASPLESQLPRLEIVVVADRDVRAYEIRRDGKVVDPGLIGTPIPIDPGEYEIAATGPGVEEWKSHVKISRPGERVTERIVLRRAAPAPFPTVGSDAVTPAEGTPPSAVPAFPAGPADSETTVGSGVTHDSESGFYLSATPFVGYLFATSGDLDASAHGMTLGGSLLAGMRLGDFLLLGGTTLAKTTDPTVSISGRSGTADMTLTGLSLSAGVGYRMSRKLVFAGLLRLTRMSLSARGFSLDSSFGPGAELRADWELFRMGRFGVGLAGSVAWSALDIEGTKWSATTAALGMTVSYQ